MPATPPRKQSRPQERDPSKRISIADVLAHEWVREDGAARAAPLQHEVLVRLQNFAALNKLQQEALKVGARAEEWGHWVGLRWGGWLLLPIPTHQDPEPVRMGCGHWVEWVALMVQGGWKLRSAAEGGCDSSSRHSPGACLRHE